MCEFISWIERKETKPKVFFLTYDQVHSSRRGKAILKRFPGEGELLGHSAIRAFYEFEGGKNCECTDFSNPKNFPDIIVRALKQGEFRGLATPMELLTSAAKAEYFMVVEAAWAEYFKVVKSAKAEYNKVVNAAEAEYERRKQDAFWDSFAIPENRNRLWK